MVVLMCSIVMTALSVDVALCLTTLYTMYMCDLSCHLSVDKAAPAIRDIDVPECIQTG